MLQSDLEQLESRIEFTREDQAEVSVSGRIEDTSAGVHVRLEARRADGLLFGSRELSAPAGECMSLRQALALVLLVLLDADEATPLGHRKHVPWELGAEVALLTGSLPRSTPGFGLHVGSSPLRRLKLVLDASYWLPVAIENARGLGAKLQAFTVGPSACPQLTRGQSAWRLWLCAGARLGGLHAAPRKLQGPPGQARLLAQLLLELKLSVEISEHGAAEASLGPVLSLERPQLYYARGDSNVGVFRPALLGAIVRLAIIIDRL